MPANEVGLAILKPLRELDEVAYLRFASVYKAFESAEAFEEEIAILRAEREVSSGDSAETVVPAEDAAQPQPSPRGRADPRAARCAWGSRAPGEPILLKNQNKQSR